MQNLAHALTLSLEGRTAWWRKITASDPPTAKRAARAARLAWHWGIYLTPREACAMVRRTAELAYAVSWWCSFQRAITRELAIRSSENVIRFPEIRRDAA